MTARTSNIIVMKNARSVFECINNLCHAILHPLSTRVFQFKCAKKNNIKLVSTISLPLLYVNNYTNYTNSYLKVAHHPKSCTIHRYHFNLLMLLCHVNEMYQTIIFLGERVINFCVNYPHVKHILCIT